MQEHVRVGYENQISEFFQFIYLGSLAFLFMLSCRKEQKYANICLLSKSSKSSNLSSQKSKKCFFEKIKLLDILKASCKSFSMKFLDLAIPETISSISPRKLNKFLWKRFLWTTVKDSIQSLTQKLTQFTWITLLYCLCKSKAKIWSCCCCKAWIAWFCGAYGFVDFV